MNLPISASSPRQAKKRNERWHEIYDIAENKLCPKTPLWQSQTPLYARTPYSPLFQTHGSASELDLRTMQIEVE